MKKTRPTKIPLSIRRLTMTALFAAMICASTMVIQIPIPGNGYINPGDALVLLGALMLGSPWGALAAGGGSALADILTGYLYYAPGTFFIKGAMALIAYGLYRTLRRTVGWNHLSVILAGLAGELIMVLGYFLYGWLLLGNAASSALGIPANLIQGAVGCAASSVLYILLTKNHAAFRNDRQ